MEQTLKYSQSRGYRKEAAEVGNESRGYIMEVLECLAKELHFISCKQNEFKQECDMINLHFRLPRLDHTDILYDQDEERHREKQDQMQEAFLRGCH